MLLKYTLKTALFHWVCHDIYPNFQWYFELPVLKVVRKSGVLVLFIWLKPTYTDNSIFDNSKLRSVTYIYYGKKY